MRAEKASVAVDGIPALREELKRDALARTDELAMAVDALVAAAAAHDLPAAVTAYRDVRRRERDLSPLVRAIAPISASGFGAYGSDKDDGAEGFRPLHLALSASPPAFDQALSRAKTAQRAVVALHSELDLTAFTSSQVGYALSDGAYTFGARLDGSDAEDEPTRLRDVAAEGGGLLRMLSAVRDAIRERDPATADALDGDALVLSAFLQNVAKDGAVRGTAAMVRATGHFGVHLRRAFAASAEKPIPLPFVSSRGSEAVSVGTMPKLRFARDAAKEQLGKQLFESTALSDNGHIACASCHVRAQGFSRAGGRPLGATGLPTPREPMSLWNIGHEVAFFWDGRAGSLEDQIDTVLARDLLTDWPAVMGRIEKDKSLVDSFQRVTKAAPSIASTKAALVAFQRSLISDDLPMDRYFRGKDDALSPEALRGFDLYFGPARCSRCHRLPLTSGVGGPRFLETELSAIGVPKVKGGRVRDGDEGRITASKLPEDRGMFRVPTLRHVAKTAPYFHNGSFATLDDVVGFYVEGGGLAAEKPLSGAQKTDPHRLALDPDLVPFTLTTDERRALVVFLQEGLSSADPGSPD